MKTPVKVGVIAMAANMVLNVLFVAPLYLYFDIGHVGLALATAVSAYLNAFLLYWGLRKKGIYQAEAGWSTWLARSALANGVMLAVLLLLLRYSEAWVQGLWWERSAYLGVVCVSGLLAYVGCLFLCGVRPGDFRYRLK